MKKKFERMFINAEIDTMTYLKLWSFIHSALEEQRKEIEKEIKGMKKHPLLFKGEYKEVGTLGNTLDKAGFEADINYNQALQDVIDLLSYKK